MNWGAGDSLAPEIHMTTPQFPDNPLRIKGNRASTWCQHTSYLLIQAHSVNSAPEAQGSMLNRSGNGVGRTGNGSIE
jgi:hypothetical protein